MKAVKISDTECNFLKDDGTYLLDEHVKRCYNFNEGLGVVQYNDDTYNYVNSEGKTLLENNVKGCYDFCEGFSVVRYNDDTENYINSEGKTLLKNNVKYCNDFSKGFGKANINNIVYLIDKECNFYNEDKVSFKILYQEYLNIRLELIKIIQEYTYHDVEEYFNI